MTSPIVDMRNIDLFIYRSDEHGCLMCRISNRTPSGKLASTEFEIDFSSKLFAALQTIAIVDTTLNIKVSQ